MARSAGAGGGAIVPLRPPRKCPVCGKPSQRAPYPFCSARCRDVDLNRWLSDSYAIPGDVEGDAGDEPDGR